VTSNEVELSARTNALSHTRPFNVSVRLNVCCKVTVETVRNGTGVVQKMTWLEKAGGGRLLDINDASSSLWPIRAITDQRELVILRGGGRKRKMIQSDRSRKGSRSIGWRPWLCDLFEMPDFEICADRVALAVATHLLFRCILWAVAEVQANGENRGHQLLGWARNCPRTGPTNHQRPRTNTWLADGKVSGLAPPALSHPDCIMHFGF
jgi:hypothetical protein